MLLSTWGIWHFWIFTQLNPFPPFFTHLLPISTTSTPFWVDFSPPWGPQEGRGYVAILISPHHTMQTSLRLQSSTLNMQFTSLRSVRKCASWLLLSNSAFNALHSLMDSTCIHPIV